MVMFVLGILSATYLIFAVGTYSVVEDSLNDEFHEDVAEKPLLYHLLHGIACVAGLFWPAYLSFFLLPKYGFLVGKKLYKKLEAVLEL